MKYKGKKLDEHEDFFTYISTYLTRHHFSINSTYVNARIKTCFVMWINNITPESLVSTNTTIVWSLLSKKKKTENALLKSELQHKKSQLGLTSQKQKEE